MDAQNRAIQAYLSYTSSRIGFNVFITIPFTKKARMSKPFCWGRIDVSRAEKIVTAFTKDLNRLHFGGPFKIPRCRSGWLPFLAIPEYTDKIGRRVPLHYHALALFPEERREEYAAFTERWWQDRGLKRTDIGSPIMANVRNIEAGSAGRVADYSLKATDTEFTVSHIVARGFLDDQPSLR